jgi:hypothetical protein
MTTGAPFTRDALRTKPHRPLVSTAPNKRLHPTRTAALRHRGAILQRVAVRAGEPQSRWASRAMRRRVNFSERDGTIRRSSRRRDIPRQT